MNELKKFLFGQKASSTFTSLCQHCIKSYAAKPGADSALNNLCPIGVSNRVKVVARDMCHKLDILSELLSKQCNVVIAQRIRRTYQMLLLYRNLYGEHLLKEKVRSQFTKIKKKPLVALLSASIFSWEKERISDAEIKACYKEVEEVRKLLKKSRKLKDNPNKAAQMEWEPVVDKDDFKVWRHNIPNTELYQYRVLGHFKDIPARAFYNTQVDVHYWKDWDKQTIDVKIIDKDEQTGSEVIHWLYRFPYPMYPREYVYVRRCMVYPEKNCMIISARATKHPRCPLGEDTVRIHKYTSQMVITPSKFYDENGFSYVMSYCDDPQTNFPPMMYNWVASSGVHEFLERMHQAALRKHQKTVDITSNPVDSGTSLYSGAAQNWRKILSDLCSPWYKD